MPVTNPLADPTATHGPVLLQVPPASALASVVVNVLQTTAVPVISDGSGFTVMTLVAEALPHPFVLV